MKYNFDQIIDRANTSSVKYDLRKVIFGKSDVIPMWVADMDFETPSFIREAVVARASHPVYGYTFREDVYYQPIIDWMNSHHNWFIKREDIVYSPGIVPALSFAVLAFTRPNDKIIVQSPVYPPFFGAVSDHQRELVINNLIKSEISYQIDFEQLETLAVDAEMLILCNPHNPVGRCWTKSELEKIADICLRNHVLVLSDEIHADLVMPGFKHQVFANLSPEISDITITAHAPSKTFNLAGLATSSVIITNETLRKKFTQIVDNMHLSMGNLFGSIASTAAYSKGEEWRLQLVEYLNENINITEKFISEQIPDLKMYRPEATYMIWLDFSRFQFDDNELKNKLIHEAGLGFNPGTDFGPGGESCMRMNIACPRGTLLEALKRLKNALVK